MHVAVLGARAEVSRIDKGMSQDPLAAWCWNSFRSCNLLAVNHIEQIAAPTTHLVCFANLKRDSQSPESDAGSDADSRTKPH
jgi:hypothetical protein